MGRLEIVRDFVSLPEKAARTLRVYFPDAYDRGPARRFPVLYLHDAQNLFDHRESAIAETWEVDHAMDAREQAGLEPWIVVAVDHRGPERMSDYTPWDWPAVGVRGRGQRYAEFVAEHLKPQVDRTLRTRPEPRWTAVGGSSLGGLISLFLGLTRPDVFGRVAAFSPSVMWSDRRLFEQWREKAPLRLYVDAGAQERFESGELEFDYGGAARDFRDHLRALGYGPKELRVVLEPGGVHSEPDWRRRLPAALEWLLKG